jgi:uncharacterized membrane protein YdjX (TVP38/TMEM64 family)
MVDGDTAFQLGQLARIRFARAGQQIAVGHAGWQELWPTNLAPHFSDSTLLIARTEPASSGHAQIEEIKRSVLASIAMADKSIYIENQFLSAVEIAQRIRDRMLECPELEVLLVAPKQHISWIESRTMRNGRLEFMSVFDGDLRRRIRLVNPQVAGDDGTLEAVMVHSKLMIIDDKMLRVGSANLNNRSMGTDTECDLVLVAERPIDHRTITDIRNRLVAHHCGVEVLAIEERCLGDSLLAAASLSANGHCLIPIDDGRPDPKFVFETVMPLADPPKPLVQEKPVSPRKGRQTVLLAGALVIPALLALAWKFTPLEALVTPEALTNFLGGWHGWSAALIVILTFVVGGLVAFPVILLIVATAASFDPVTGLAASLCGILASAALVFATGRLFGEQMVRRIAGGRLERVRNKLVGNGVLAVALIRLVPIAPFSLVNLVAGALRVGFTEFMLGTVLGMVPGLVTIFALGATASKLLQNPTPSNVTLLVFAVALWLLVSISAQHAIKKIGRRR